MITSYYTFGQNHIHRINGRIFDKDCVVEITAENPRKVMFSNFGNKWSAQYPTLESVNLRLYPRGVIKL